MTIFSQISGNDDDSHDERNIIDETLKSLGMCLKNYQEREKKLIQTGLSYRSLFSENGSV